MKIIYTILFFVDTLILIGLSFWFLKLLDTGVSHLVMVMMAVGILSSISLLVFLLHQYFKPGSSNRHN